MTIDTTWLPVGLESVALRLARADQAAFEVGMLSMEWSRAGGQGPLILYQVEDPPGTLSLVVSKVRPIPPALAMLFSEAINHLRAAIDNTVFYLVEQEHGMPEDRLVRRIAMPIYNESGKLDNWFRENDKAGLPELGVTSTLASRIRSLQPFADESIVPSISEPLASLMGVEVVRDHPLLLLQAYSNEDKHHSIRTAAARSLIQQDDQPFLTSDRSMRPIQPGDVLTTTPKGKLVMVDSNAAVHVERPGGTAWVSPGYELNQLRTHVASMIIPTLITGQTIPRAFPPSIDLSDTGQTDRERIDTGTWQTAHERMTRVGHKALAEALSTTPFVPPIVNRDHDSGQVVDTH